MVVVVFSRNCDNLSSFNNTTTSEPVVLGSHSPQAIDVYEPETPDAHVSQGTHAVDLFTHLISANVPARVGPVYPFLFVMPTVLTG